MDDTWIIERAFILKAFNERLLISVVVAEEIQFNLFHSLLLTSYLVAEDFP